MDRRPGFWKALHAERCLGSYSDIFSFEASRTKALLRSGLSGRDYVISYTRGRWFTHTEGRPTKVGHCVGPSQDKGMHAVRIELYKGDLDRGIPILLGDNIVLWSREMGWDGWDQGAFHPHQASFEHLLCGRPGTARLIWRPWGTGQSRSTARIFTLTQSHHYWCEACF